MKLTRKAFEQYLNKKAGQYEGSDYYGNNYGSWLRRTDPIAFTVEFNNWKRNLGGK